MKMTESNKIRTETQLDTLDAVLSAITVAEKWFSEKYPNPYLTVVEEQSMKELSIHLQKARAVLKNYIDTLLPLKEETDE